MLSLALALLFIAILAGVLGFGMVNAFSHLAKVVFFGIIILFVIIVSYMSVRPPATEPIPLPSKTEAPAPAPALPSKPPTP